MKKNIIVLFIVLLLTFSLAGSMPVMAEESLVQDASIIDKIENIDLSGYQLNSYTQQYLLMSNDSFVKKYGKDSLYSKGVIVEGGLRFTDRFKGKVIGDLTVGATRDSVVKVLGKPNLDSAKYSNTLGISITGYKTKDYYLIFNGDNKITDIAIIKRDYLPQEYYDMIKTYVSDYLTNADTAYDDIVSFYEHFKKDGTKTHIHGGGWSISYSFGLQIANFVDENTISVYNNFEGNLFEGSDLVDVEYVNEDSVFRSEIYYYISRSFLESAIKREGKQSPNKKLVAYADNDSLYSDAFILIRYLDASKADKKISVGYFTNDLKWLNSRYIFFTAMYQGIFIYDTTTGSLRELTKEFEKSKDNFREYTLKSADSKRIVYLDRNSKQITLTYSFDKTDKMVIKRTK